MKEFLVVDDLRVMHFHPDVFGDNAVTYARTNQEAIDILKGNPKWDIVWLDHDMGNYSVIKRVVNYLVDHEDELDIGRIYCHSSNPVGRRNTKLSLYSQTNYIVDEIDLHAPYIKDQIIVESLAWTNR